jgi:hypothetical protein
VATFANPAPSLSRLKRGYGPPRSIEVTHLGATTILALPIGIIARRAAALTIESFADNDGISVVVRKFRVLTHLLIIAY